MIDVPIGKAIVPVARNSESCKGCCFNKKGVDCAYLPFCMPGQRRDGKNVVFKIVKYKEKK